MKTADVIMHCKIYTESFPDFDYEKGATGEQIMEFLLDDCGCTYGSAGQHIEGDLNLWYLATNEKHGVLSINGSEESWGWGGSCWERVEEFVRQLKALEVFSKDQYNLVMEKIKEGKDNFNFMYDIANYLESKEDEEPWEHPGEKGRDDSLKFFGNVIKTLEDGGYKIVCPD